MDKDMPYEIKSIEVERLLKKVPLPYYLTSLAAAIFVFLAFELFSEYHPFLQMDLYHRIQTCAAGILVAYQPAGACYFLNRMRAELKYLLPFDGYGVSIEGRGRKYLLIVGSITLSYVVIQMLNIFTGRNISFYVAQPGLSGLLLDIFNQAVNIFNFFMLSVIFWMYVNIFWSLRKISSEQQRQDLIHVDLFDMDRIGGLSQIREFILRYSVFYFVALVFSILSFVDPVMIPFVILSYENIIIIILLFFGIYLFISSLNALDKILISKIKSEIEINRQEDETLKRVLHGDKSAKKEQKMESLIMFYLNRHEISWLLSQNASIWNFTSRATVLVAPLANLVTLILKYIIKQQDPSQMQNIFDIIITKLL